MEKDMKYEINTVFEIKKNLHEIIGTIKPYPFLDAKQRFSKCEKCKKIFEENLGQEKRKLDLSYLWFHLNSSNGYYYLHPKAFLYMCRKCHKNYDKKWKNLNSEKIEEYKKNINIMREHGLRRIERDILEKYFEVSKKIKNNLNKKRGSYSKEWLTIKELDKLFASPKINARDLLLMRICYYGALRISEVLVSKQEDYIKEGDFAFLILRSQKTDKRNWEKQPIPMHMYSEIKRYCESEKIKTQDRLFQSRQSSSLSYQRAIQIVKECVKKAQIDKNITTHTFRRSRLQHMLDAGEDPYFAQDFARHKSIDTTRNYLKISKQDIAKRMNEIDKKSYFM